MDRRDFIRLMLALPFAQPAAAALTAHSHTTRDVTTYSRSLGITHFLRTREKWISGTLYAWTEMGPIEEHPEFPVLRDKYGWDEANRCFPVSALSVLREARDAG